MAKDLKIGASLYPKQQEMLRAILTCDSVLYGGSVGSGKSFGVMIISGILMNMFPGVKIRAIRESFRSVEQNLVTKFKEIYPEKVNGSTRLYKYNKSENIIYWHNGSQLIFDYCASLGDAMGKHGLEQDILIVDEAVEHFEDEIKYLVSRTRTNIKELGGAKTIFTGNAKGPGLVYFRKEFVEATEHGQYIARKILTSRDGERTYEKTYAYIPAFLKDNFALMDSGYEREVLELNEALQRALLDADWYVSLGQHLSNFNSKYHVYKKGEIHLEEHWKRHISMDWGINDYCAIHWWATDEKGTQYCYREYYENNRHIEDVAKRIAELSVDEDIEFIITPHDLFRKQPAAIRNESGVVIGETPADVLQEYQPFSLIKADSSRGSRKRGWRACHRLLYLEKDDKDQQTIPRVRIIETAKHLIEQVQSIESNPLDIEEILPNQEDHAIDSFRYNADTTFSNDRSYKPKKKIKKGSPEDIYYKMMEKKGYEKDEDSAMYYDSAL